MINSNSSLRWPTLTTAGVAIAVGCFLFVPRVRAFITYPSRLGLPSSTLRPLTFSAASHNASQGMPNLPSDVVKYTQVPKGKVFTATTIPSGLLKQHNTKKGTWGIIRVSKGKLEYAIHEPKSSVHILDANHFGVIEPMMLHQVKPLSEDVEFVVEFWRVPGTGEVNEKREGLNE